MKFFLLPSLMGLSLVVPRFALSYSSKTTYRSHAVSRSSQTDHITAAENTFLGIAQNKFDVLKGKLPPWMRRIDFSIHMADYYKPEWLIRTIQPLYPLHFNMVDLIFENYH